MSGWTVCLPCAASFGTDCVVGRNTYECSNFGDCTLRTCRCQDGWTGSDCGTDVRDPAMISPYAMRMLSHVFLPQFDLQTRVIATRTTPSRTVTSSIYVRVARSGALDVPLRVLLAVRATGGNTTALPQDVSFPQDVVIPAGQREVTVSLPTAAFASSVVGGKCRALALELIDFYNGVRLVTNDVDRFVTLFFDDMNGAGADTSTRATTATYTPSETTNAVIDRAVVTRLTLLPSTKTATLSTLPLSLRVAIDWTVLLDAVALLPAVLAQLQIAYPAGVRAGLLSASNASTATSVYADTIGSFLDAASALASSSSFFFFLLHSRGRHWELRFEATDADAWAREDSAVRRVLLVFFRDASTLASPSELAAMQDLLVARALLVVAVLPVGVSAPASLPSSAVLEVVATPTTLADVPQRIATALQTRDATLSNVRAIELSDTASLVSSPSSITISLDSGTRLPRLVVSIAPLPSSLSRATVTLSIPGFFLLSLSLLEPGASCFDPPSVESSLPVAANEDALSGWVGVWRGLSLDVWRRQGWTVSPTQTTLTLTEDASLLRSQRTTVLRLVPPSAAASVSLTRTFSGDEVPTAMNLVLRGFVRHVVVNAALSGDDDDGIVATCVARLELVPAAAGTSSSVSTATVVTRRRDEWMSLLLSVPVRSDLTRVALALSCSLVVPGGSSLRPALEWTSLGLVPDPTMACQCPPGTFFSPQGACQRCPAGSYCVAGLRRPCARGTFSFGAAFRCEVCRDGWICVDGLVRLCEPGTFAADDARSCTLCPRGYACRNGRRWLCPPGRFSLAGARECEICPPGTISTTSGYVFSPISCVSCTHWWLNNNCSCRSSTCTRCPLGATSNYHRVSCVACAAGENTSSLGQHPCASCSRAAFSLSAKREICVAP
ncbi:hypothetical protein PINS_up012804 [Pythium insidiosum]|nr:hypothetical protein PINS_up012804 [Pythium insidiosum]